jgi:hypothetical protein
MAHASLLLAVCGLTLDAAALLVPERALAEWKREWKNELWHRRQSIGIRGGPKAWGLYRDCMGAFADAWWQFTEADSVAASLAEKARSPSICLALLGLLLAFWFCVTGRLPTTRAVFRPLPYANGDHIALISRTGRMEAVRRGIPVALAELWADGSRSIRQLAICSFATRRDVTVGGKWIRAISIAATPNLFDVLGLPLPRIPAGERHSGIFLSHRFWERQFHGNPQVAGLRIEWNGSVERIAGVLPDGFWWRNARTV